MCLSVSGICEEASLSKPLGLKRRKAVWILQSPCNCLKQENSNWVSSSGPRTAAYLKQEADWTEKAKPLITHRVAVVTVPGTSFRNYGEITSMRQEKITHSRRGFFQRLVREWRPDWQALSLMFRHLCSRTFPACFFGEVVLSWFEKGAWQQAFTTASLGLDDF